MGFHPDIGDLLARGSAQGALHEQAAAAASHKFARRVFVRGVVEVSNYCRENCAYCGMRRDNRSLQRARARHDEIAEQIIHHRPSVITDINLQTGEDPVAAREVVLPLLRTLRRETDLGLSVCLGTLDTEVYAALKAAGATVYILKFESAAPAPDFMLQPHHGLLISANRCTADFMPDPPDPVFPLGLAHINAALRRAGHETRWLDRLSNADRLVDALREFQPDFVGISLRNIDDVLIRQREEFYDELAPFTATIRQHSRCPVVLGGSGFSIFPEKLLALTGATTASPAKATGQPGALVAALKNGGDFSPFPAWCIGRTEKSSSIRPRPARRTWN
jgi:hypothetical protein